MKITFKLTGGGTDRLRLIRSEKNSNTPGMPRNVGIRFSRGEYILFIDADDAITPTALEELYPIAKQFDADVVYCEKFYQVEAGKKFTTDKNLLPIKNFWNIKSDFVTEPKLVLYNDIDERIKDIVSFQFAVTPWNYLIRRDFISEHGIKFPNIKYAEDNVFVFYIVFFAKNIVRVPNIMYIYRRDSANSINNYKTLETEVRRYTDHVFQGVSIVHEFSQEFQPLKSNPKLQYDLFEWITQKVFHYIAPLYAKFPAWQLEPLIIKELDKIGDKTPLTAFLFSRMTMLNLQLNQYGAIIQQQNQAIQQLQQKLLNDELQLQFQKK